MSSQIAPVSAAVDFPREKPAVEQTIVLQFSGVEEVSNHYIPVQMEELDLLLSKSEVSVSIHCVDHASCVNV